MSSASQEWVTTHAYTFRSPNVTPGYTGYVPQQRFAYGDTFGNTTAEHFQTRRNQVLLSSVLQSSKKYKALLASFPTVNSNDPSLVLADRKRTRERWMTAQKYERGGTKDKELQNFLKSCQQHREHYRDNTGTAARVDLFLLPKLIADKKMNETSTETSTAPLIQQLKHSPIVTVTDYIKQRYDRTLPKVRANCRQRAIRDQFFEIR